MYQHKLYGNRIVLSGNVSKKTIDMIDRKCREANECMIHKMNYAMFEGGYRLYRRGKNRCLMCGVKRKSTKRGA